MTPVFIIFHVGGVLGFWIMSSLPSTQKPMIEVESQMLPQPEEYESILMDALLAMIQDHEKRLDEPSLIGQLDSFSSITLIGGNEPAIKFKDIEEYIELYGVKVDEPEITEPVIETNMDWNPNQEMITRSLMNYLVSAMFL